MTFAVLALLGPTFLRDDAVLVVVVITDEDEVDQSAGDPTIWKQALVDAKGGNEEAIVVLDTACTGFEPVG